MLRSIDQLGNVIELAKTPQRIVSIVPSQTELLYSLGLGERVVGITKFCIHPNEWFTTKKRVGGTKDVKLDLVKALQPDLIIANKEENEEENVEALKKIAPVWLSDIYTLKDSYQMITSLGGLCGVAQEATSLVTQIQENFSALTVKEEVKGKKVLYLIWRKPYMGVAKNTFIDHLLTAVLSMENVLKEDNRYPEVDFSSLDSVPDYVFLSSEPYPFKEKHIAEIQEKLPNSRLVLVDGEYFSWYGSRLLGTPDYLQELMEKI